MDDKSAKSPRTVQNAQKSRKVQDAQSVHDSREHFLARLGSKNAKNLPWPSKTLTFPTEESASRAAALRALKRGENELKQ